MQFDATILQWQSDDVDGVAVEVNPRCLRAELEVWRELGICGGLLPAGVRLISRRIGVI